MANVKTRKIESWHVYVSAGHNRRCLVLTLTRAALKAAMPLLRAKGYRSIYVKSQTPNV